MFSTIKDFIMGTAITPFVDGTNWARTMGWVGLAGGALLGVAGPGIIGGAVAGGIIGVVGGAAAGMAFGLLTGGIREVAEGHENRTPPVRQAPVSQPSIEQQRRAILERQRANGTQQFRAQHTKDTREIIELKEQNQELKQQLRAERRDHLQALSDHPSRGPWGRSEEVASDEVLGKHTAKVVSDRNSVTGIPNIGRQ